MDLTFDSHGLIPAVVQEAASGEVLMVAWMNADALRRTRQSGEAYFWSRSRGELWHKGETSGKHITRARGPGGLRRRHLASAGRRCRPRLPHGC